MSRVDWRLWLIHHPFFRHSCQREALDRIFAARAVWLDGIETWNASFCGIGANRVAMRVNREAYGWSEIGSSDAHTLGAIGRGRTWFEGKSAEDVRRTIELRLSAPGGKLWGVIRLPAPGAPLYEQQTAKCVAQ